jgi:hypothetical protein
VSENRCTAGTERSAQLVGSVQTMSGKKGSQKRCRSQVLKKVKQENRIKVMIGTRLRKENG